MKLGHNKPVGTSSYKRQGQSLNLYKEILSLKVDIRLAKWCL